MYSPLNCSYYIPKSEPTLRLKVGGSSLIQHSTPVVELRSPFIPVNRNKDKDFFEFQKTSK